MQNPAQNTMIETWMRTPPQASAEKNVDSVSPLETVKSLWDHAADGLTKMTMEAAEYLGAHIENLISGGLELAGASLGKTGSAAISATAIARGKHDISVSAASSTGMGHSKNSPSASQERSIIPSWMDQARDAAHALPSLNLTEHQHYGHFHHGVSPCMAAPRGQGATLTA